MNGGAMFLVKRLGVQARWRLRWVQRRLVRWLPAGALSCLLVASIALGGATRSNQEYWAALEILTLIALALTLTFQRSQPVQWRAPMPAILWLAFVAVGLLQLIPLPWNIWAALPGHGLAAEGLQLLGLKDTAHPLSLAPDNTITALLRTLPAAGMLWLALRVERRVLFAIVIWLVPALGLAATGLGIAQSILGNQLDLHPYSWTNRTFASGPFANVNHQGTFLLMCLPFAAIHAAPSRWSRQATLFENLLVRLLPVGILIGGIILTFSGAAIVMAPMVLIGSFLLTRRRLERYGRLIAGGALAATIAAMGVALFGSTLLEEKQQAGGFSERSRAAIYAHTLEAATDFLPFGSGLGSFENVYPAYEETGAIEPTYVNHAHNEYLEVFLELGAPGVCILIALLLWWVGSARRLWINSIEDRGFNRAAMAASVALAVVIVHSLVDYPVRAPAISGFSALCVAVMLQANRRARPEKTAN